MLQCLALEQLHGDEWAILKLSNVMNRADVWMIERGCSTRFAAESLDGLSVLGDVVRKKFQRNVPAETRVLGFVDDAHSTAAQFFQDAIVGNCTAGNRGSICHWP